MTKEDIFTKIEEETNNNDNIQEIQEKETQKIFITNLPDWDLEPPYEPIKRSNKQ